MQSFTNLEYIARFENSNSHHYVKKPIKSALFWNLDGCFIINTWNYSVVYENKVVDNSILIWVVFGQSEAEKLGKYEGLDFGVKKCRFADFLCVLQ